MSGSSNVGSHVLESLQGRGIRSIGVAPVGVGGDKCTSQAPPGVSEIVVATNAPVDFTVDMETSFLGVLNAIDTKLKSMNKS